MAREETIIKIIIIVIIMMIINVLAGACAKVGGGALNSAVRIKS